MIHVGMLGDIIIGIAAVLEKRNLQHDEEIGDDHYGDVAGHVEDWAVAAAGNTWIP
jgi:hypothetical protein